MSDDIEHLRCIKFATKAQIVDWLIKRRWSSQTESALNKYTLEQLQQKLLESFIKNGRVKDVQLFEDMVCTTKAKQAKSVPVPTPKRDDILQHAKEKLAVGKQVGIYDYAPVGNGMIRIVPIQSEIIAVSPNLKKVDVRICQTRNWQEAGGYPVYKDQKLSFIFDNLTGKWLREGLTGEMCKSYDDKGRVEYFKLTYTKQYLMV